MSEADAVQVHQERDHGGGGEDVVADGGGGHGFFVLGSQFAVLGSQFAVLGSQFSVYCCWLWGVFGLRGGEARFLWWGEFGFSLGCGCA